jgi:hypothetical protein
MKIKALSTSLILLDGIDANGEFEVQVFAIQRDYGMTDRAQAPQAI